MEDDLVRRVVRGTLTLALTTVATWLAGWLTEKLLGPELLEED